MPQFTQPLAVDAAQIATGQLNTARLPDVVEVATSVQAGGATNYTKISANGCLLGGDAARWDDLNAAAISLGTAASAPDPVNIASTGIPGRGFDGNATTEQLFWITEIPHSYREGTAIELHAHWTPATTGTGTVIWRADYFWVNRNGTFSTATTITVTHNIAADSQWDEITTNFALIAGTGMHYGSRFGCRFYRDPGTDTYTGDAVLTNLGLHFQTDTPGGSAEIDTK